jgi:glutathione S-transferase
VLEHKGLAFKAVDGLLKSNHDALRAVNGRVEVPALVDGDIVAYLKHRYPQKSVYPAEPAARVHARAWDRTADTLVDGVLINVSYWLWAERKDTMPAGLLESRHGPRLRPARAGSCGAGVHLRGAFHR